MVDFDAAIGGGGSEGDGGGDVESVEGGYLEVPVPLAGGVEEALRGGCRVDAAREGPFPTWIF